jgi:hypothetical protein
MSADVDALARALYAQFEWSGCAGSAWDRRAEETREKWRQNARDLIALGVRMNDVTTDVPRPVNAVRREHNGRMVWTWKGQPIPPPTAEERDRLEALVHTDFAAANRLAEEYLAEHLAREEQEQSERGIVRASDLAYDAQLNDQDDGS